MPSQCLSLLLASISGIESEALVAAFCCCEAWSIDLWWLSQLSLLLRGVDICRVIILQTDEADAEEAEGEGDEDGHTTNTAEKYVGVRVKVCFCSSA
jgi:hypothetical protein